MILNYLRLRVPGLDDHISTNPESMHYSHKYENIVCCAIMSTVASCNVQASKAEIRSAKISKNLIQKISRNLLQDDLETREFLMPWAEEIVYKQRAQIKYYWIIQ